MKITKLSTHQSTYIGSDPMNWSGDNMKPSKGQWDVMRNKFHPHERAIQPIVMTMTAKVFHKKFIVVKIINLKILLPHHPHSIRYHRNRYHLIRRESEPESAVRLDEPDRESIEEVDDDEYIESIVYPPCSFTRV